MSACEHEFKTYVGDETRGEEVTQCVKCGRPDDVETKHEREARLGQEVVMAYIDSPGIERREFFELSENDKRMHATDLICRLMHYVESTSNEADDLNDLGMLAIDGATTDYLAEMRLHAAGEPWDSGAL